MDLKRIKDRFFEKENTKEKKKTSNKRNAPHFQLKNERIEEKKKTQSQSQTKRENDFTAPNKMSDKERISLLTRKVIQRQDQLREVYEKHKKLVELNKKNQEKITNYEKILKSKGLSTGPLDELKNEIHMQQSKISELTDINKDYESQIVELEKEIHALKVNISEMKKNEGTQLSYSEIDADEEVSQSDTAKLETAQEKIDKLDEELKETKTRYERAFRLGSEIKKTANKRKQDLQKLTQNYQKSLDKNTKLQSDLNDLEQKLTEEIDDLKVQNTYLEEQKNKIEQKLNDEKQEIKKSLNQEKTELKKKIEEVNEELSSMKESYETEVQKSNKLNQQLDTQSDYKDLFEKEAEKSSKLKKSLDYETYKFSEEKEAYVSKIEELTQYIDQKTLKADDLHDREKELEKYKTELENKEKEFESESKTLSKKIEKVEATQDQLTQYKVWLDNQKKHLRKKIIEFSYEIKAAAQFSPLNDYLEILNLEINKIEILMKNSGTGSKYQAHEKKYNELVKQKKFISETIKSAEVESAQKSKELTNLLNSEELIPTPPLPTQKS